MNEFSKDYIPDYIPAPALDHELAHQLGKLCGHGEKPKGKKVSSLIQSVTTKISIVGLGADWENIMGKRDQLDEVIGTDRAQEKMNTHNRMLAHNIIGIGFGLLEDEFWKSSQYRTKLSGYTNLIEKRLDMMETVLKIFEEREEIENSGVFARGLYLRAFLRILGYHSSHGFDKKKRRGVDFLFETALSFEAQDFLGKLTVYDSESRERIVNQTLDWLLSGQTNQGLREFIDKQTGFSKPIDRGVINRMSLEEISEIYDKLPPKDRVEWLTKIEWFSQMGEKADSGEVLNQNLEQIKGRLEELNQWTEVLDKVGGVTAGELIRVLLPNLAVLVNREHERNLPDLRDGQDMVEIKKLVMRFLGNMWKIGLEEVGLVIDQSKKPALLMFLVDSLGEGNFTKTNLIAPVSWVFQEDELAEIRLKEELEVHQAESSLGYLKTAFDYYRARESRAVDLRDYEAKPNLIKQKELIVKFIDQAMSICLLPVLFDRKEKLLGSLGKRFGDEIMKSDGFSISEKRQILMAAYIWSADEWKQLKKYTESGEDRGLIRNCASIPLVNYAQELFLSKEPDDKFAYIAERIRIGEDSKVIADVLSPWKIRSRDRTVIHIIPEIPTLNDMLKNRQPEIWERLQSILRE